jgi:uncharacterized protein YjbJ (UPF0337 family)
LRNDFVPFFAVLLFSSLRVNEKTKAAATVLPPFRERCAPPRIDRGEEISMSSSTDLITGSALVAIGRIKRALGRLRDDRLVHADGEIDEAVGRFRIAKARAKAAMKKAIDAA